MVLICSRNCATITTGLGQFHGPACAPLPEDIPYLLVVASFPPALGNPWSNFCLLLCLYGTLHMDGVISYVLFVTKWFLSHCVLRFTCFVASHWLLNFTFSKSDFWLYFILNFSEKAMAPHSSTLAWKIPRMEKPGRLQSVGSLRVGHDWATSLSCIGEGNGNPLECSCLENPRDGGAWWAAVYGLAQSRTRLKRLNSSKLNF